MEFACIKGNTPLAFFSYRHMNTLQEMVLESVRMERVDGWRAGLIPFAKDLDDTFLVSRDIGE